MYFDDLFQTIKNAVGNNMDNKQDDVIKTKAHFERMGRYNNKTKNGYIDKELNSAIWNFQKENNLKQDGYMNPDGETEKTVRKKLKDKEKFKTAGAALAVPAFIATLSAMMGLSVMQTYEWYKNQSSSRQRDLRKQAEGTLDNQNNNPNDCNRRHADDTKTCNNTTSKKGKKAGAICHSSASERYASCLSNKPEDQWPNLQE